MSMKYPLYTQSKPVSGLAAKKLLEAIDSSDANGVPEHAEHIALIHIVRIEDLQSEAAPKVYRK